MATTLGTAQPVLAPSQFHWPGAPVVSAVHPTNPPASQQQQPLAQTQNIPAYTLTSSGQLVPAAASQPSTSTATPRYVLANIPGVGQVLVAQPESATGTGE